MSKLLKAGFREILMWIHFVASYTPGRIGHLVRQAIFRRTIETTGNSVRIGIDVEVTGGKNIQVGNEFSIMKHSSLYAHNGAVIRIGSNVCINSNTCIGAADGGQVIIGDNVMIAQNVVLRASDHKFESLQVPIKEQGHTGGVITIGNDCWIGANAVITRNVTIGNHSIVAAGAVVTADVEPHSIVAGVPAKLIRKRIA